MTKPKPDPEMEKFQADLLQSVREYKAGKFARKTEVTPTDALQARTRMALSQSQFAKLLSVSVRTLQHAFPMRPAANTPQPAAFMRGQRLSGVADSAARHPASCAGT